MACPTNSIIRACDFTSFLVNQQPVYDKLILADVRPEDGWILHVETGTFPAYSGTQHTLDRFNHVFPDTTKQWVPTQSGNCLGNPCDKTEHCIGWGATRITYHLEEQSWQTPLLCFDNDMHITHAKEHFRQIISDILKPATTAIMSNFLRKRVLFHASHRWSAMAGFGTAAADIPQANATFTAVGNAEVFFDIPTAMVPTSKLTPQMLQRRVHPLMLTGYMGKQPFKDMPPLIELVLGMETAWELDKQVSGSNIGDKWRFQDWDNANKYWRYGFTGQLGNYAVRVDPMALRFNRVGVIAGGLTRFQVVLPYRNVVSSGAGGSPGLRSEANPDYELAEYEIGYIWHRRALQALMADATPVNPEMPFSSRNFGGKWQFVMDNLGQDANGVAIENKRRNKGQFIADFKLAIRPQYTEFCEALFYKREPACLITIDTCAADPGYPTQHYESCNDSCAAE
jgi:hypothetical protein